MNIYEFKEGDIITRSENAEYPNGHIDCSYVGDKIRFIGLSKGTIFLVFLDGYKKGQAHRLGLDAWALGWEYWPQTLEDKTDEEVKRIMQK
jgi:hypothetical protein